MPAYTVTQDTTEDEESATCPSCSKLFKIRYKTATLEILNVENSTLYETITVSCKRYRHSCEGINLISNS